MRTRIRPPVVAVALAGLMLAAGCSGSDSGSDPTPDSGPDPEAGSASGTPAGSGDASDPGGEAGGDPVVLTFLSGFTGGDRPAYEALVAEFNETHPDIRVEMEIQPWDSIAQTLPSALASGEGPDLATPDYNVATIRRYAENGLIAPLDGLIGDGEDQIAEGVLPESVVEGFTIDGELYAAPANFATLMLYYNEDIFAEAGISEPPGTMDELREVAAQLTTEDRYGIALADNQTIAMWPILIWADGGDVVDAEGCSALDSPESVEAVSSWATLVAEQGISPVGQTGSGADGIFAAGQAAMQINGPWATGAYTEAGVDFDVAPVPVGDSGEPVTLASTVPIVLNAQSENAEAAQTFMAWWNTADAQAALAEGSGFPPTRTDMDGDPRLEANPFVPKFAAQAPNSRLWLPGVTDFATIDADVFSPAIGAVTRGEDVQSTLSAAAAEIEGITGCQG